MRSYKKDIVIKKKLQKLKEYFVIEKLIVKKDLRKYSGSKNKLASNKII